MDRHVVDRRMLVVAFKWNIIGPLVKHVVPLVAAAALAGLQCTGLANPHAAGVRFSVYAYVTHLTPADTGAHPGIMVW